MSAELRDDAGTGPRLGAVAGGRSARRHGPWAVACVGGRGQKPILSPCRPEDSVTTNHLWKPQVAHW